MTEDIKNSQKSERKAAETSFFSRRTVLAGMATVGVGAVGMANISTVGSASAKSDDSVMCSTTDSSSAEAMKATYSVRIENVSTAMTLETTAMEDELKEQPVPLSPGVFAVHNGKAPIFRSGEPERDNGLEEVAEDGMPTRLAEWLAEQNGVSQSGAFTTPVGMDAPAPAPLTPGSAYEFEFEAMPGDRLSFVTMFVPSNDLFYSPDEMGIDLFTSGEPIDGDVTDRIGLWDAGTEINEEPGVGEHQPQRQRGSGVGLVERESVVPISEVNGYTYPDATDVLNVTVSPHNG